MFFFSYLGHELRRRMKQAVVIAVGLALGIGLVITVSAASSGVKKAESDVLSSLYGVGTDVTVTKSPDLGSSKQSISTRISLGAPGGGSGGVQECVNNKCKTLHSGQLDNLVSMNYSTLSDSAVASIARLHDVASAVGGLVLSGTNITIPTASNPNGSAPSNFTVDGLNLSHTDLGPFSNGTIKSGHTFTAADSDADVAVVDANYATANSLKVGSKVTIAGTSFTVIGIISQPQGSGAPDIYIPLARAQALATIGPGSTTTLKGDVNTIYVTAANSADIATVQKEISKLFPTATVTTAASLASEITGSLSTTAKLANDLGKWLAILVLIAAFAVASLLTLAAVTRRVREFGTLKALGWRSGRLVGQVLGESITTGIIGGAVGVGLGFAGAALITKIAPKLSAVVDESPGQHFFGQTSNGPGGGGPVSIGGPGGGAGSSVQHTFSVPLAAQVGVEVIIAAVLLAVLGGLLAGVIGSWRIGRLRPAVALATVE
jgi:putative ABC transport system permease protein